MNYFTYDFSRVIITSSQCVEFLHRDYEPALSVTVLGILILVDGIYICGWLERLIITREHLYNYNHATPSSEIASAVPVFVVLFLPTALSSSSLSRANRSSSSSSLAISSAPAMIFARSRMYSSAMPSESYLNSSFKFSTLRTSLCTMVPMSLSK